MRRGLGRYARHSCTLSETICHPFRRLPPTPASSDQNKRNKRNRSLFLLSSYARSSEQTINQQNASYNSFSKIRNVSDCFCVHATHDPLLSALIFRIPHHRSSAAAQLMTEISVVSCIPHMRLTRLSHFPIQVRKAGYRSRGG